MRYCDFCGEEILGSPYRRRRQHYCSRSCADEHAIELTGEFKFEEDDEDVFEEEFDEEFDE